MVGERMYWNRYREKRGIMDWGDIFEESSTFSSDWKKLQIGHYEECSYGDDIKVYENDAEDFFKTNRQDRKTNCR